MKLPAHESQAILLNFTRGRNSIGKGTPQYIRCYPRPTLPGKQKMKRSSTVSEDASNVHKKREKNLRKAACWEKEENDPGPKLTAPWFENKRWFGVVRILGNRGGRLFGTWLRRILTTTELNGKLLWLSLVLTMRTMWRTADERQWDGYVTQATDENHGSREQWSNSTGSSLFKVTNGLGLVKSSSYDSDLIFCTLLSWLPSWTLLP